MTEDDVSGLGEWGLIEAITSRFSTAPEGEIWSGDDAAVLGPAAERLVLTTDVIVEGVDFDLSYSPPESVGAKGVAVNVSDIAAMGAHPRWLVATLTLPPTTPTAVVEGIADGMAEAANASGVGIVGGDVSRGRDLALSVAMIGTLPGPAVTRSGARAGDLIAVTGSLGAAAGGLLLLRTGSEQAGEAADRLRQRQLRPTPRTEQGAQLAAAGVTAMIDISDGLLADLVHVLDASDVGCRLDPASIPVDGDLSRVPLPEGTDPLTLALTGGEDFELLFTFPEDNRAGVGATLGQTGTEWAVIGRVTEAGRSRGDRSLDEWDNKGWEHLRHP